MSIELISRASWKARAPKGAYTTVRATKGVKVHYTGGYVDPATVRDHSRCVALVRQIQNSHMDGNGWIDIGYTYAVCAHRKVFVGRGPNRLPAANGPGLNSGHYAVLGLVGSSGLTQPPDGMLHGILDAIEYLRANGGAGREIKGHRDGYATACPGEPLYVWVRRGAPRPGGASISTPTRMEDLVEGLPLLKPGATGIAVKRAFYLLASHGPEYALDPKLINDTIYGPPMVTRVEKLQKAKKITVDGIIGPQTWTVLIRP